MLLPSQARLVRFGVFEFDLASGELSKAGRRIRLQNQPRQVLRILVARRGELVTREELRRELWPDDTFVDFDNGLNVAIRKIRDALGDAAPSPRFIETERAQGYRFIAPITEAPAQAEAHSPSPDVRINFEALSALSPSSGQPNETFATVSPITSEHERREASEKRAKPRAAVLAVIACVVFGALSAWLWSTRDRTSPLQPSRESPSPVSLAVLPLTSGPDQADGLLAAGIADGIITRLSSVRQFRVRPTSAVARYLGKETDAQEVGRDLRSQYVLLGTLRTAFDRIRVSVQLVDATNGSTVWGNQYDVARGDLFGVEDTVASEIATALRLQISDGERQRFHRRYTRSGAAYERYLMGRARMRSVTEGDTRQAIAEFESARDLDPDFAPAYAGLATAATQLRVRFAAARDADLWDARAREEAGRALQLDPDLAEAHVALAAVHRFQEYDWDTVIRESQRAIELSPSLDVPHVYLAVAYFHIGLLEEAESAINEARQLNPESRVEPLEILGAIRLFAGRSSEAVRYLSEADGLSDSRIARYLLGWASYYEGERQRAEALLGSMISDEGPVSGNARATLAAIRAARRATADARHLAAQVASEQDLLHHAAYGLGTAYAQLRDPPTALRWLSQAAATGFACYPWFERDPLLDPIRTDARFSAFMRELRRSWEDTRVKYSAVR
jgi:TolB-like protein/DNA-binding winged helix-turn-helix (wHTH) protein/tetratricopeptide (TPR) repeat protein